MSRRRHGELTSPGGIRPGARYPLPGRPNDSQKTQPDATSLLVIQVQRKVVEWLRNHIAGEEMKFAAYLRSQTAR